jgi:hypothetical protein
VNPPRFSFVDPARRSCAARPMEPRARCIDCYDAVVEVDHGRISEPNRGTIRRFRAGIASSFLGIEHAHDFRSIRSE